MTTFIVIDALNRRQLIVQARKDQFEITGPGALIVLVSEPQGEPITRQSAAPLERRQTLIPAGWGLLAGFVAFLMMALLVNAGKTQTIDEWILRSVRSLSVSNHETGRLWAEESIVAITSPGTVVVLAGASATVLGLLFFARKWQACLFLALALLGAIGLNQALKPLFARPRPDVVRRVQAVNTLSFPSGHALISTAVYASLATIGARLLRDRASRIYLISISAALTLAIGLSRIYLGVHYPSDVLAGWVLGLVWAAACSRTALWLQTRRHLEPPQ